MKLNTLDKIAGALETLAPEIKIESTLLEKAQASLKRMMAITRGETVTWPTHFNG